MLTFLMRTFALSLSIFIRALPMWLLLAAVLYLLLSMLSENPLIFLFIVSIAFGTTLYFMMFSQIRVGLSVLGETTAPDLGKLVFKSFKFFRFVAAWTAMVGGLTLAGFFVIGKLGFFDLERMVDLVVSPGAGSGAELEAMFNAPVVYIYAVVSNVLAQLAYCAVAVPMAANAAACSPKARDYEIFWGFGACVPRMFILSLVAGTVAAGAVIGYVVVAGGMVYLDGGLTGLIMGSTNVGALTTQTWIILATLVLVPIMGFVWFLCLWCAGATLSFLDHRDIREAKFRAEIECIYEAPMDPDDLRALRMARMQGGVAAQG